MSPTDLYCNVQDEQSASIRVIFHAVGKMLSGPAPWRYTESGRALMYREIQSEPFVSVLVYPQRLSATKAPALEHFRAEELICIDLRMTCPNEWVYPFESGRS
ncbi:hypothetical protein [Photobacterium sp. 1_MG-2023]|uniref:hypothetical protein n=1 Tax=Photobacterium sp. 1_MG-2023 TaxID=3062646 RepID=UPI0026E45274|nr:hypothetical protein [Photobacterium sp. 1_MG-2023]MDO6707296.1 hypothetical protein [Photobacterium sp. 1_MG-2023]